MTTFDINNIVDNAFSKVVLCAAYIRVSSQEQKLHGLSLDAQKMKIEEYAKKNNYKIVEWYMDEGVSGRKLIRNRPELQRMIQDAEKKKFEKIIFIKLDRFFRSVAEYHECMKRIAPVEWETTEEEYNLSTANGRMLVNMKLTIAELEADQTGERIRIVNDYKVQTGQPLFGDNSMPFGFCVDIDKQTGKKKVIRNPEVEEIVYDLIDFFLTHQSKSKTVKYIHAKYHIGLGYNSVTALLKNSMLCGSYRDNPAYCEAYIDTETFGRIQMILKKNIKENTAQNRVYLFSGLIKCPECGRLLKGNTTVVSRPNHKYVYKKYRCAQHRVERRCNFGKAVSENVIEELMINNIEKYFDEAKIEYFEITDSAEEKVNVNSIEEINAQIDRLNYSWQTGKIRTVEQYEKQFAELSEKLEKAQEEQEHPHIKDFSKIEKLLCSGWKEIYRSLDDAYKRAFWRSFVKSVEIEWTDDIKRIKGVEFF